LADPTPHPPKHFYRLIYQPEKKSFFIFSRLLPSFSIRSIFAPNLLARRKQKFDGKMKEPVVKRMNKSFW
jgi:hypothetical protein